MGRWPFSPHSGGGVGEADEGAGPPRAEAPPGFEFGPGGIISSSGMKAHELARELGISQKELVNFLQQRRLTRNAAAPLAPGAIEAARTAFKPAVATKIETNG